MSSDPGIDAALRHLNTAARAERVILEAHLSRFARRGVLLAFAGLIAVFGLAALDGAAYLWLAPIWGPAYAMVAVALGDFVIAALVAALASLDRHNPELAYAEEMRDSALAALELDVKLAGTSFLSVLRNPFELFSGPLVSLAMMLLGGFIGRRRKAKAE
jgi:hypothetical protein